MASASQPNMNIPEVMGQILFEKLNSGNTTFFQRLGVSGLQPSLSPPPLQRTYKTYCCVCEQLAWVKNKDLSGGLCLSCEDMLFRTIEDRKETMICGKCNEHEYRDGMCKKCWLDDQQERRLALEQSHV